MTSNEKYRLLEGILGIVHDYSVNAYSITKVVNVVLERLKSEGYQPEVLNNNRDFRVVKVEDEKFRILRNPGWGRYDVIMVD